MTTQLILSGKEQEFFAELCSIMRSWWYEVCVNNYATTASGCVVMGGRIQDLLIRYDYSPQALDRFYDLMHRTGANS